MNDRLILLEALLREWSASPEQSCTVCGLPAIVLTNAGSNLCPGHVGLSWSGPIHALPSAALRDRTREALG